MKSVSIFLLVLLLEGLALAGLNAQSIKVISFNIRLDAASDGIDRWDLRKKDLSDFLIGEQAVFIGLQEVTKNQLDYLNLELHDYAFIGVGRDDGLEAGEFSPILYDTSRVIMLSNNTFWLSESPDSVSVGWDAMLPRICTYGLFMLKANKQQLFVFNTHFDHIGEEARQKSAELILRKISEVNQENMAVVLLGDLNRRPDTKTIQLINNELIDGFKFADEASLKKPGTYNGFDLKSELKNRIDYVFVKNIKVSALKHGRQKSSEGRWLSDHLPVIATLQME
ncbi:MAG: endonuclease/exonuclease/phosphatase family protein [Bacteroidetes bacterium]|nr:endonuclease/exonuclease/phosphatase family protein [Bacteroidota bacterium]MBU1579927.1 endonuclease/exonuclease/phosphatase family protein [Bacteroidota bacterium]MBU2556603.1 endonuclease/exonuclease/phosphatase family protein [Bacteroidota bacterium]